MLGSCFEPLRGGVDTRNGVRGPRVKRAEELRLSRACVCGTLLWLFVAVSCRKSLQFRSELGGLGGELGWRTRGEGRSAEGAHCSRGMQMDSGMRVRYGKGRSWAALFARGLCRVCEDRLLGSGLLARSQGQCPVAAHPGAEAAEAGGSSARRCGAARLRLPQSAVQTPHGAF